MEQVLTIEAAGDSRRYGVDVEDAEPFVVIVRGNVALRPDSGVVDDDVQAAEPLGDMLDGGSHRGVVGHVALHAEVRAGFRCEVQDRYLGAARGEAVRDGRPDPGSPTCDDCREAIKFRGGHGPASGVGAGDGNRAG
jgi:hypothetical protein